MICKPRQLPMELLKETFEVDESSPTGLKWKNRPRRHFCSDGRWIEFNRDTAGKSAGGLEKLRGRKKKISWRINIYKKVYFVHRIVYALAHNIDPDGFLIDHIDGNPLNNKVSNLRLVDYNQNSLNRMGNKGASSKYKGVCFAKYTNRWRSLITNKGKTYHLGYFDKEEDARDAYREAAIKIHGEFAKFELDEHEITPTVDQTAMAPLSELNNIPSK